jgi:hypothetical protein
VFECQTGSRAVTVHVRIGLFVISYQNAKIFRSVFHTVSNPDDTPNTRGLRHFNQPNSTISSYKKWGLLIRSFCVKFSMYCAPQFYIHIVISDQSHVDITKVILHSTCSKRVLLPAVKSAQFSPHTTPCELQELCLSRRDI